jgi:hypothetical protein
MLNACLDTEGIKPKLHPCIWQSSTAKAEAAWNKSFMTQFDAYRKKLKLFRFLFSRGDYAQF